LEATFRTASGVGRGKKREKRRKSRGMMDEEEHKIE